MTYDDFLDLDVALEFGPDMSNNETFVIEDIWDQLPDDCETRWGATQFVIIVKSLTNVIKIPFNGEFDYDYKRDSYTIFHPFRKYNDYCAVAVDIYNKAIEEDVEKLFLETSLYGYCKSGKPIYLQQKIASTYEDGGTPHNPSKDSLNKAWELDKKHIFPDEWLADAIDYYGEEYVNRFVSFCKSNVSDLHCDNIGYTFDGMPVVLDYSGYYG